ncbi:hypothetical protein OG21DRAFT_1496321 [Imleria badia]|nr:hypothetical protein OG21DRAFT_1496321 [Imleria badia]
MSNPTVSHRSSPDCDTDWFWPWQRKRPSSVPTYDMTTETQACIDEEISSFHALLIRLQNLKIWVDNDSPEQSWTLFHGDTPTLHTLEPSHCPVPWYAFKLSGLTTLSVSGVPIQLQQSILEFLATLSSMQRPTQLNLEDVLASHGGAGLLSSAAFNAYQMIDLPYLLPYLSRLSVSAPLSTVITLLSCINVPSNTDVKLKCDSERDSSLDHRILLSSVLAQRLSISEDQALSSHIIRTLVIETEGGETGLTFSRSERDSDNLYFTMRRNRDCYSPLQIFFDSELSLETSDGDNIINDICCSIPLPNVQSLHACSPPYSSAFWRKFLGHFPDLRYLKLSDSDMPDLASVLTGPTTHEDEENQGGNTPSDRDQDRILVPRLEELELDLITFSPGDHSDTSGLAHLNLFVALYTRNAPPGRLTMTHCNTGEFEKLNMNRSWDDLVVVESDSDSLEGGSESD